MVQDFEEEIPVVDDAGKSQVIKAKSQTWASLAKVKEHEIPSLKDMIENDKQILMPDEEDEGFLLSRDEQEIEKLKEKQKQLAVADEEEIDYESIAKEIIKKSKAVVRNKPLEKRLLVNLALYLREVKKIGDLKRVLLQLSLIARYRVI